MDINEFIKKHRKGIDVTRIDKGRVLLEYYPFEEEVINGIHDNQYTIIKKSRQMHLTTILAAYVAWYMIFNENNEKSEIVYCSNRFDISKRFVTLVSAIIYDYYGEKYVDEKIVDKKTQLTLKNGNTIRVHSNNIDSMKGWSLLPTHMYIFDEAAFLSNLDDFINTLDFVKPNDDIKVVVGSTPNGFEYFHRLWDGSVRSENKYYSIDLPYYKHPKRDEKWAEEQRKILNFNDLQFNQEILGLFIQPQPKPKKNKTNLIQFRVSDEIMNQIGLKLIEKDVTISDYIRDLVKKDIVT
jgi:hypothetical protein